MFLYIPKLGIKRYVREFGLRLGMDMNESAIQRARQVENSYKKWTKKYLCTSVVSSTTFILYKHEQGREVMLILVGNW